MIFVDFFFWGALDVCFIYLVVYWFFYGNSVLVVFDLTIERWVLLKF